MNPQMMMNPPEEFAEHLSKKETKIENLLNRLGLLVPDWIFDGFILDSLFNKEIDFDKIIQKIVPDLIVLSEADYKLILLHLEKKYDILRKGYNWFADYQVAKYRHEILELYSKIVNPENIVTSGYGLYSVNGSYVFRGEKVNNYVKLGIMPAPVKKKYSREHIAYLIIICSLKQALPISDIKKLIDIRVKRTSIEETLNFFSDLYDSTFNTIIAIGKRFNKKYSDDDVLFADTALYMAIGSSGSKYVASQIAKINKEENK
jgi:DNA-binding transcriptional MerR regulator